MFIAEKLCFSIEKQSLSVDKQCLSNWEQSFSINCVFRSKNTVYRAINRVYQIEMQSFLINSVCFSIEKQFFLKTLFFVDELCLSTVKTMFFRNSAFHSINWVFCDKLCFSSKKQCFSIEKHCLSAINSVFRFITHLVCHRCQGVTDNTERKPLSIDSEISIGDCYQGDELVPISGCWQARHISH